MTINIDFGSEPKHPVWAFAYFIDTNGDTVGVSASGPTLITAIAESICLLFDWCDVTGMRPPN